VSLLDAFSPAGGSSSLAKIKIQYEDDQPGQFVGSIEALFNPSELKYEREVDWRVSGLVGQPVAAGYQKMEFQATPPRTLSVELFFDTYEGVANPGGTGLLRALGGALVPDNPFDSRPSAVSVTTYTERIAQLARVNVKLHRPPVCKLYWGAQQLICGVLTHLAEDYSFFLPDGTPVRAALSCSFKEYLSFADAARAAEVQSADVDKRWIVRRGDTLAAIAVAEYGDPSRWRAIADENGLDNPRALSPGQVLLIPKIEVPR
jgi:hypothetical protein